MLLSALLLLFLCLARLTVGRLQQPESEGGKRARANPRNTSSCMHGTQTHTHTHTQGCHVQTDCCCCCCCELTLPRGPHERKACRRRIMSHMHHCATNEEPAVARGDTSRNHTVRAATPKSRPARQLLRRSRGKQRAPSPSEPGAKKALPTPCHPGTGTGFIRSAAC